MLTIFFNVQLGDLFEVCFSLARRCNSQNCQPNVTFNNFYPSTLRQPLENLLVNVFTLLSFDSFSFALTHCFSGNG
jgi:hypothetical protein